MTPLAVDQETDTWLRTLDVKTIFGSEGPVIDRVNLAESTMEPDVEMRYCWSNCTEHSLSQDRYVAH